MDLTQHPFFPFVVVVVVAAAAVTTSSPPLEGTVSTGESELMFTMQQSDVILGANAADDNDYCGGECVDSFDGYIRLMVAVPVV